MTNIRVSEVPEFCCLAGHYGSDFDAVAVLNLSYCYLIECANYDLDGSKTCAAYIHMPSQQFEKESVVNDAISSFISSFTQHGGDIATVKVKIFGGLRSNIPVYTERVRLLKDAFSAHGITITRDHLVQGMWIETTSQAIDFMFSAHQDMYLKMIDPNDEYKDEFPHHFTLEDGQSLFRILRQVYDLSHEALQASTQARLMAIGCSRDDNCVVQDDSLLSVQTITLGDQRYLSNPDDHSNLLDPTYSAQSTTDRVLRP